MRYIKIKLAPAGFFALLLFISASLPKENIKRILPESNNTLIYVVFSDPFMHFFSFGLLTLILCFVFFRGSDRNIPFLKIFILTAGYAIILEFYQGVLPWRSFRLDDLCSNIFGVIVLLIIFRALANRKISS